MGDLINDILQRLPPKSLKRFRCVCKSWRSIISDSRFVKSHLNRSECKLLLSSVWYPKSFVYSIDYDANNAAATEEKLPSPLEDQSPPYINLWGTCNGLVIMATDYGCSHCWNPATREIKQLANIALFGSDHRQLTGFYFDSIADDYKLAVVSTRPAVSPHYFVQNHTHLLSLKTNTWSNIKGFPYTFDSDAKATLVHGWPHWMVRTWDNFTEKIIYLEVTKKEFKEFSCPMRGDEHLRFNLGVLGGCVCVTDSNYGGRGFYYEVWIMKEYGVEESWTKLFVIPELHHNCWELKPLSFTKNGELVSMGNRKTLLVYNPRENTVRKKILAPDWEEQLAAAIYVESLVSPY